MNVILLHESVCVCARIGDLTGLQNNIQVIFKILKCLSIEAVKGFLYELKHKIVVILKMFLLAYNIQEQSVVHQDLKKFRFFSLIRNHLLKNELILSEPKHMPVYVCVFFMLIQRKILVRKIRKYAAI